MKIAKYQYGATYTPISRAPIEQSQSSETATGSKSKSKTEDDLIDQEIIKTLGEKGIPIDTDYFLNQAESFLRNSTNIFSSNSTNTISQLIRIRALANRLSASKELYDKAIERVDSENTGSDVAISATGQLYVYDEKEGVKKISPENYANNSDKYYVLTNSELLHLRAQNPDLKFNESILHDISNSIGMKTVMEQVIKTIKEFGTVKTSGYTQKANGRVQQGLEALMSLGPDGLYELSQETSKGENIEYAVEYLYRNLNNNAKNVLVATTAAEGLSPTRDNVLNILKAAIFEHTGISTSVKAVEDPNAGGNSGSGKGDGAPIQDTWGDFLTKGGGSPKTNNIVMPGGNINFLAPSNVYNTVPIAGKEGSSMNGVTLGVETFQNLQAHGVADASRKSYFGDIPIQSMAASGRDILVDNSNGGREMWLPINAAGELDFGMWQQMTEIEAKIINNRITDPNEKRKIWESNGFEYNEALGIGVPINETLGRYWVQNAYSSTKAETFSNSDLKNSVFLDKVGNDILTPLISSYNLNPENKSKTKIDLEHGWWGTGVKGLLFIPLHDNQYETAVLGGIAYTNKPMGDTIKARQDAARAAGEYNYDTGLFDRALKGTTASALD